MPDLISLTDLPQEVRSQPSAELMVAGANAQAERIAPCLVGTPSAAQLAEAKLILLGAITRWTQQGASGIGQQTAGPFSMAAIPNQSTGYRLWPSEVSGLIAICSGDWTPTIDSIDTAPGGRLDREHSPGCDFWYANGCTCGLY